MNWTIVGVADVARSARAQYRVRGKVHLFMAVPVGLAMMIGQLLNILRQVQTYEHVPERATGRYVPAALLGDYLPSMYSPIALPQLSPVQLEERPGTPWGLRSVCNRTEGARL